MTEEALQTEDLWQRDHPLLAFQFLANFFIAATPVPREGPEAPQGNDPAKHDCIYSTIISPLVHFGVQRKQSDPSRIIFQHLYYKYLSNWLNFSFT